MQPCGYEFLKASTGCRSFRS